MIKPAHWTPPVQWRHSLRRWYRVEVTIAMSLAMMGIVPLLLNTDLTPSTAARVHPVRVAGLGSEEPLLQGRDEQQILRWADEGHIVMSMATKGNVIFIENLSRSLMRLGMTNFCAVALDEQALQQLEQNEYVGCVFPDVFVFQSSSETDSQISLRSSRFDEIQLVKYRWILRTIQYGIHITFLDADMVVMKDFRTVLLHESMAQNVSYIGLPWNVGFFHFFSPLAPQPSNYKTTLTTSSNSNATTTSDAAFSSVPVKILHYEPCNHGQQQSEICVRKSIGSNKNATKYVQADKTGVKRLKRSTTVAAPKSSKATAGDTQGNAKSLDSEPKFQSDFVHGHPNVSYGYPVMDLLGDFLEHMQANPGRWDQDEWKDFTTYYQRHKIKSAKVKKLYTPGDGYMHMFTKHGPAMPLSENLGYIYHTTVGFGWTGFNATPLKKYMMRELQAWFAEPQLYEESEGHFSYLGWQNAAVMTAPDSFPDDYERSEVAAALGAAVLMNRTLLLPYMRCSPDDSTGLYAAHDHCFPLGLALEPDFDKPKAASHMSLLQGRFDLKGWNAGTNAPFSYQAFDTLHSQGVVREGAFEHTDRTRHLASLGYSSVLVVSLTDEHEAGFSVEMIERNDTDALSFAALDLNRDRNRVDKCSCGLQRQVQSRLEDLAQDSNGNPRLQMLSFSSWFCGFEPGSDAAEGNVVYNTMTSGSLEASKGLITGLASASASLLSFLIPRTRKQGASPYSPGLFSHDR